MSSARRLAWVFAFVVACGGSSTGTPTSGQGAESGTMDGSDGGPDGSGSDGTSASAGAAGYHPEGYVLPEAHGMEMKLQAEDCRDCHGDDLHGGESAVSCDGCHAENWRTDCVFCHGGEHEPSGAPPRDIDGTTDPALLSFIAHGRHVTQYQHAPYDCVQCHNKPTDVTSVGHIFDDTPARAEVDFTQGISPAGAWDGTGTCGALYCHGDGRTSNGSYQHDQTTPSCGGCHPFPGTENVAFATMSGRHAKHMGEGVECAECHDPVAILVHVDGKPDVALAPAGITFDSGSRTCQGVCHLQSHGNESW